MPAAGGRRRRWARRVDHPLTLIHLQTEYQRLIDHGVPGDWDVAGTAADLRLTVIEATVVGALALLAGIVLFRPIGRGARWARIVGWVAAAFIVLGAMLEMSTDANAFPNLGPEDLHTGDHFNDTAAAMLNNMLPGWYQPLFYTAEIVCLVAMLAVAWLLRTHGAGEFFEASTPPSPEAADKVWDLSRIRRGNAVDGR